jgi:putative transcriptional regulator
MVNRLPELRREHGLTQQQLADLVEVSRQTIISIEAGKFNPSVILAFKFSHVFQSTIEEIFFYKGGEGK